MASPKIIIPLDAFPLHQSGYLYAQSAGSTGADNSAPGIHLRWSFSRELADKHLAKGELAEATGPYPTTIGFNKNDDFIKVYRTEYKLNNPNKLFPAIIKLTGTFSGPNIQIINSGPTREWRFLNIQPTPDAPSNTTNVFLRFSDVAQYDNIRTVQGINPATNPALFISSYTGMLEVETPGKLLFAATIGTSGIDPLAVVKIESISTPDRFTPLDKIISCRKVFTAANLATPALFNVPGTGARRSARVVCENIERVRFTYDKAPAVYIAIETYQDFIIGSNGKNEKGEWELVGGEFCLSLDDNLVFRRLENLIQDNVGPYDSVYVIDKTWPKYNEVDTSSGAFAVNVPNYQNKWDPFPNNNQDDPNSLRVAVEEYLDKSKTDVLAIAALPVEQPPPPALPDSAHLDISYLKMLNMVALDYHVARMLGLGHIDVPQGNIEKFYVHVVQYYTAVLPSDLPPDVQPVGTVLNHLYMTLPTNRFNFRLPPAPVQKDPSYGIFDNSSVPPIWITTPDPLGYSLFDDSRFVNINKEPIDLEVSVGFFFEKENQFCICDLTKPILYGVEYRKQGETDFRKPELSNDPDFLDHASRPEVVPILEKANPIFVHQEFEEGFHEYALYSINWFSRPSVISNIKPTDETEFTKRKTILPPLNLNAQLIQKESPRIFTTQSEQDDLDALIADNSKPDKTLVRITFDWNNIHNTAYQYGTYAEFFYREDMPENIRGEIDIVSNPDSTHQVSVTTKSYNLQSTSPMQTVQPNIALFDINRYIGGLLTTDDGKSFVINNITTTGNNPTLLVQQIRVTESNEVNNTNVFSTVQQHISPSAGHKFMIVENLNTPMNWDSYLVKRIGLIRYNTDDIIEIINSTNQQVNKEYTVESVLLNGVNTDVKVKENIPGLAPNGAMKFERMIAITFVDSPQNIIRVKGNVTAHLSQGDTITVLFSEKADADYSVDAVNPNGTDTDITVSTSTPVPTTLQFGKVIFTRQVSVVSVNTANRIFTVSTDITAELIPSHRETVTNADLSVVEYNVGGIFEKATIIDIEDKYPPDHPDVIAHPTNPPQAGDTIPNSKTGFYKITFTTFQLENHPDPEIEWYKGTVRILEDVNFLPPNAIPQYKSLDVLEIKTTTSTLELIVYDPTFDAIYDPVTAPLPLDFNPDPNGTWKPIQTGANRDVNFHPSYRTYLFADTNPNTIVGGNNNFEQAVILPLAGQNTKQTFMAARAVDTTDTQSIIESFITTPVIVLAREIVTPQQPGMPIGPIFATRPDFYGKATYTIDVKMTTMVNNNPRKPYALILLRANERRILDLLYKPDTAKQVITELANLQSPDSDFFNNRWNDLVNGLYDTANALFNEYTPGGFRFPLPDNAVTTVAVPNSETIVTPFAGTINSLDDLFMGVAIINWVKAAVDAAFLPLTEQPVIFQFVKPGIQTSGKKPVIRNANGDILAQSNPAFDPFPMTVKYAEVPPNSGIISVNPVDIDNAANNIFVRFTDFTLDGSARNVYFYYAIELSNNFEFSLRSPIAGPVQLVDAAPAEEPIIRRTIVQLADPLQGISTAVRFELNEYIASENIRKIQVYRAITPEDALSIRTMTLAKTLDVGDDVVDDFSDQPFPLFGESLFYRIIALREIVNEQSLTEFVPSKPSSLALTNIVDNLNPPAPKISFTSDPPTTTQPINLNNVVLSWPKVAHNASYHLYKMNTLGNWEKIFSIKTNTDPVVVPLSSTTFTASNLYKQDADLNTIYHRFRVQVENSSGLLNIGQNELTI